MCSFQLVSAVVLTWLLPANIGRTGSIQTLDHSQERNPEGFTGTQSTAGAQAFPSTGALFPSCLKNGNTCT